MDKPSVSATGYLVRKYEYGDTSLILTWLTREQGFVKTMARGALRPKSSFRGLLDLFYEAEIHYKPSPKSDLHLLAEVYLLSPHLNLRRDFLAVETALYFADLLQALSEPDAAITEHYDLYGKALAYLEQKKTSRELILRFEKKALAFAGLSGDHLPARFHGHDFKIPVTRTKLLARLGKD